MEYGKESNKDDVYTRQFDDKTDRNWDCNLSFIEVIWCYPNEENNDDSSDDQLNQPLPPHKI